MGWLVDTPLPPGQTSWMQFVGPTNTRTPQFEGLWLRKYFDPGSEETYQTIDSATPLSATGQRDHRRELALRS